jgi:peptidoglycan/LPS O-acetylase OafA/YrhL
MGRIDELEGLRGILAVWVVIVHLLPAAGIDPHVLGVISPFFGDVIRVQIFCIMSGFVIFIMLSKTRENYLTYIVRRFSRLYPLYIFTFFLSVAFSLVALQALTTASFQSAKNAGRIAIFNEAFSRWPEHIFAHATLFHGIIPDSWLPEGAYTFLGQAWNISTEFQFYIIVPFLFWVFNNRSIAVKLGGGAAIVIGWWLTRNWPNSSALPHFAVYFLLGIISYYAWQRDWSRLKLLNPMTIFIASVLALPLSVATAIWIYVFGYAVLVRDKGTAAGLVSHFLTHPIMLWLGGISYSLYLLHMIPLYGWMAVLNRFELDQWVYFALLTLLTLGTAVPMAYFSFKYVETLFYRSKSRRNVESIDEASKFRAA